jgi:hypothetical protein
MSPFKLPIAPVWAQSSTRTVQTQLAGQPLSLGTAAPNPGQVWMTTTGGLFVLLVILGILSKMRDDYLQKRLRFEIFKNKELKKKVKLAVETISKMERNPDLIHSREFNLDYLRMRMEEEQFHFAILNQIRLRVKDNISQALRPIQAQQGQIGVASSVRHIEETFDVKYEPGESRKGKLRVLFRVQVKLYKLPTQPTSVTVDQIIDCIDNFLSSTDDQGIWQPAIQGRLVNMHWDQRARPTPLLVLEQTPEGSNVTFRSSRRLVSP